MHAGTDPATSSSTATVQIYKLQNSHNAQFASETEQPTRRISDPAKKKSNSNSREVSTLTFADGLLEADGQHLAQGGLGGRWRFRWSELISVL
jgi:hypothetical protein